MSDLDAMIRLKNGIDGQMHKGNMNDFVAFKG